MRIHLYTICWDEADVLGFFFRHYDPIVDRYVVYDDGSTDGSVDLLRSHPKVELRRFERAYPDSFVLSQQSLWNGAWKEGRGNCDWVIVSAVDEHLKVMGGSVREYLDRCTSEKITAVPAIGYQMISEEFPARHELLCETRTLGLPHRSYNRLCVFNPDAVIETGFQIGQHVAAPQGSLHYPARDELMNLHYKFMNFDRVFNRHAAEEQRLGSFDRLKFWARNWDNTKLRTEWDAIWARATPIGLPGFQPWLFFEKPLWWRATC